MKAVFLLSNYDQENRAMVAKQKELKIKWYRIPLSRETLADVNQRSDWKGLAQTVGHLSILFLTGFAAWYAAGNLPLPLLFAALFLHGTCFAFLLNGFHELCHKTVFKTKALNTLFLYIVSFLGWHHPVMFWTSHQEHHKYTLHPPYDLEVVLPVKLTLRSFLMSAVVNPWDLYGRLKFYIRLSSGRLEGAWENHLFPGTARKERQALINWARIHLAGHLLLVVVSLALGLWMIPVLVTLAPFYGGWLLYLCNNTQHVGLRDNVDDFRLCTRTILLNPALQFLYWHMNYHIEHHMFAAVPCYNLGKLHRAIKPDLPHCPSGLLETWRQIIAILKKQEQDPTYQFNTQLPIR
jgi:fatty acid desaturase